MFHQEGTTEASKDQVVVQVMPEVLDGKIPKEMTIHPYNAIHPRPHLTSLPARTMIHVLPSRHHGHRCGRKWSYMSSSPFKVSATDIYSPLRSPSGSKSFKSRYPATSSLAPQSRSLSAETTLSIIEMSLGAR